MKLPILDKLKILMSKALILKEVKRAKKFADFKHGSMKDNPDEWIKTFNDKLDKLTKGE